MQITNSTYFAKIIDKVETKNDLLHTYEYNTISLLKNAQK